MLRRLSAARASVRDAMVFCLDCAAASQEVVETLTEALTIKSTTVPRKVARLFLVSDLLHNSAAPGVANASSYRSLLEARLPAIFASAHDAYAALESRMAMELMREQVLRVLRAWEAWSVYPAELIAQLERAFLDGAVDAGGHLDGAPIPEDDVDGEPLEAEGPVAAQDPRESLRAMSLRDLVDLCQQRRVSSAGSKAEMVERLVRHAKRKRVAAEVAAPLAA